MEVPTVTVVEVQPQDVRVLVGGVENIPFIAWVKLSDGTYEKDFTPTWSTIGDSVIDSVTGIWTIPQTPGEYIIECDVAGVKGEAAIFVDESTQNQFVSDVDGTPDAPPVGVEVTTDGDCCDHSHDRDTTKDPTDVLSGQDISQKS